MIVIYICTILFLSNNNKKSGGFAMLFNKKTRQLTTCILLPMFLTIALFGQELKEPTPPGQRFKWYEEHVAMKEKSIFKDLKWEFIGPRKMSGRVTDVAVPKGKQHTIYVAAASGGIWKTTNQGTTWEPVFEHAASTSIGDIAVAPSNPEIVWAGTGEANIFRSSMSGSGIYKSTDAGKTWQHMGLAATHTIARIIIHPENPDIVYVAASGHEWTYNEDRGVYKTTDGGKTWEKIFYINEKIGAIDLVIDPSDVNTLTVSMWNRIRKRWSDPKPGPDDGLFKTTDGGKTWKPINNGLPDAKMTGRIGLDISQSNPNVVYAYIDNHEIARIPKIGDTDFYGRQKKAIIKGAEVYRSENKGESWKKVSPSNELMEEFGGTYGWVFGQIRVDPNNENTVYIMGLSIGKSTDGGKSFKKIRYEGLHGDHHAMWIDPENSDYIINGNDGGVNFSYDAGKTWINDEILPIVQFYNVTADMANPFHVYGSIQDNFSYRGSIKHVRGDTIWEWEPCPGGEASYHAPDPFYENILYSEGFYGHIERSELKNGEWESKSIYPKVAEGEPKLRGQWLTPFIISPHNPFILYHGMQYLFRSTSRGETWEKISPDLTYNDPEKQGDISYATISSISESPLKFGLIYVGTDDGKVHVTKDHGNTWTEIMEGLPNNKHVSRIVASGYEEGGVYLTLNGKRDDDFNDYIYKSVDYGKTWADISANIPGGPVNVIREDPVNKDILYLGTDLGVYVTIDGGKNWQVLANNIPTTYVHDLFVHPRDKVIIAATHGRGMFILDIKPIEGHKK